MDSGAVDRLSRVLVVCCLMRVLVARCSWWAVMLAARGRAVVPLGDLTMTKKTRGSLGPGRWR